MIRATTRILVLLTSRPEYYWRSLLDYTRATDCTLKSPKSVWILLYQIPDLVAFPISTMKVGG